MKNIVTKQANNGMLASSICFLKYDNLETTNGLGEISIAINSCFLD
jgi:hypothetical protein